MPKKQKTGDENIETGMVVEATKGDLGEDDVSKPKVSAVARKKGGEIEKLTVQKGVVFKKTLDIPADRIQSIEPDTMDENSPGKVVVDVSREEAASLSAVGDEELASEEEGLLDKVELEVPTAEGLRELEASNRARGAKGDEEELTAKGKRGNFLFQVLGPGFLGGMAGNDASAVAAYSVDGATNGYGHLWLLLLSTPLYQSVQFACAKLGRITQKGLAEILREHYSRRVAIPASLILIIANLALIAADLVAIGSGIELITGVSWVWFVVPVAVILWYFTVYRTFETIKKIFIIMSLAFVSYFITAF